MVKDNAYPFFFNQLNMFSELTEDELLDAICFFCDFIENTDACKDAKSLNEISKKFLDICTTEIAENS